MNHTVAFFRNFYSKHFHKKQSKESWIDNFSTGLLTQRNKILHFQAFFVPVETGYYKFFALGDDLAKIYLSTTSDDTKKKEIIDITVPWQQYVFLLCCSFFNGTSMYTSFVVVSSFQLKIF